MRRQLTALAALAFAVLAGCAAEQTGRAGSAPATPGAPVVTAVTPAEGSPAGGTLLAISGRNLPRDAVVSFPTGAPFDTGPLATEVAVDGSGSTILCVTPPGAPGRLAPVLVRSMSAGSVVFTPGFRYLAGAIARALAPTEGPMAGGTELVVAGERLVAGCTVLVGGVAATGVRVSEDGRTLRCLTPAGASAGAVEVAVTTPGRGTTRMPGAFRYQPPPRIAVVEPPEGAQRGGSLISIEGEGFRGDVAVTLGGVAATEVVAAADGTSVRCRAPARDEAGPVDVAVAASVTGSVTATAAFTYAAGPWERAVEGLDGGEVAALAFGSASVVYAGTRAAGVFTSGDGGASWAYASWPESRGGRFAPSTLVSEPGSDAVVYAASFNALARSEDRGVTWVALDVTLPVTGTYARAPVAVDPADASVVMVSFAGGGVFRSTDRGATWADVSAGLGTRDVSALAIDPAAPAVVYAGTLGGVVMRSADGGATWASASAGIAPGGAVTDIVVHPTSAGTVYALAGGVVHRSRDAGASWSAVNAGLPGAASALELVGAAPSVLYAAMTEDGRVFRSADGGSSWQSATAGMPLTAVRELAAVPGSETEVFAATTAGVLRTADGGGGWAFRQRGVHALALTDLVPDPLARGVVYAAAGSEAARGGGVFRSGTRGRAWEAAGDGLESTPVVRLAAEAGRLLAATRTVPFRSEDGARTWSPRTAIPSGGEVTALRFDPRAAGTAYAAVGGRVWRTLTAGDEWTELSAGLSASRITDLLVDPRADGAVYAAGAGRGVQRLREGVWADASTGLALASPGEMAPGLGSDLLVMIGGPFRTDSEGEQWVASDAGIDPRNLELMVSAPGDRSVVYAAGRGTPARVYRSVDGGRIWQRSAAFPGEGPIVRIAVDPRTADIVYVAQRDGTVYRTVTGGE